MGKTSCPSARASQSHTPSGWMARTWSAYRPSIADCMLVAPIMWYGTTGNRRPDVHALDFATAPASAEIERAPA